MTSLDSLCPLDGRYYKITQPLHEIMGGEIALDRYRIKVEGEYLIALSEHPAVPLRAFTAEEIGLVRKLSGLNESDEERIREIEKTTNHDLKAVEYFMREKLAGTTLDDALSWIHFALTSEDVNNIAYALMFSDSLSQVIIPSIEEVYRQVEEFAQRYHDTPMLARTHGQPASPTTFGKEFKVFSERIYRQLDQLKSHRISAKLNGATGNYNAHYTALPNVNWINFSRQFIESFNSLERIIPLEPNIVTTQIEPHDSYVELFDILKRLNTILIGLNQDIWRYISDEWASQKQKEGEIGSSAMPHKVNPINFENSEGNLGTANALLGHFTDKLLISRLQRDLSDSTVLRQMGEALGYCLVGYDSLGKGLGKISVNEEKVRGALQDHPEILAEAIQTILRREGRADAYEQLKDLTRGREVTLETLQKFADGLPVDDKVRREIQSLTPAGYTGLASVLVNFPR